MGNWSTKKLAEIIYSQHRVINGDISSNGRVSGGGKVRVRGGSGGRVSNANRESISGRVSGGFIRGKTAAPAATALEMKKNSLRT